ncbi:MAG: hypothetical protein PHQ83_05785 [Eubacteriales bacterium]|nr:hypothetical protein [Eubacteriales bacterium]
MDYLFFGINALATGLVALLLFQQLRPKNHQPLKLAHYAGALFIIVAYFGIDQVIFSNSFWGYYLANSLPILFLAGTLFTVLKPQTATRT